MVCISVTTLCYGLDVLAKEYECLTCHKPIKLSKIDNAEPNARKKWERFELDGATPHQCVKKKEKKKRSQQSWTMALR
jgi:hypothetical protein